MRIPLSAVLLTALLITLGPSLGCDRGDERRSVAALSGPAIAYSGYRENQSPATGILPSQAEVEQDLRILERHWSLIRTYSADGHSEDVLEVIRREGLNLKVMLGIWLDREPGKEEENAAQIAAGIRLAKKYEDIVVAVNVGNEVLIEWTEHPVEEESVTRYVREVRAAVRQPITVADNYVWWRDFGSDLAREVDFITIHTYPIWERKDIDEALSYTVDNFDGVRQAHPEIPIVIGEAGWATYTEGNLHVPRAGDETKQRRYFEELSAWSEANDVTTFYFEAFDEPWKSSGTEQHWGLFSVGRHAKPAVQTIYPDLLTESPTSPEYPAVIRPSGPPLKVVLSSALAANVTAGSVNPMGPGIDNSAVESIPGVEGDTALALEFNGESWGGLYIFFGGYDLSSATGVSVRLQIEDGVTDLELKLEGPENHGSSVNLLGYVVESETPGWTQFWVPVGAFDGVDFGQLAVVGLWNPTDRFGEKVAGRLVVDEVRFTTNQD